MPNEQKIRQIVREELARKDDSSRFRLTSIPNHKHDGVDSLKIRQENIIPSVSVSGRITFAQETDYTINLNSNFTPSRIELYGIAYDASGIGGYRTMTVGTANLGPSFYLQPVAGSTTSVQQGTKQYPFPTQMYDGSYATIPLQSCTYLWVSNGSSNYHGQPSEGHILNVEWGGTIYARMTVTDFSKSAITLRVDVLDTNWEIYTNIVIT